MPEASISSPRVCWRPLDPAFASRLSIDCATGLWGPALRRMSDLRASYASLTAGSASLASAATMAARIVSMAPLDRTLRRIDCNHKPASGGLLRSWPRFSSCSLALLSTQQSTRRVDSQQAGSVRSQPTTPLEHHLEEPEPVAIT